MVTAPAGTSLEEARRILHEHRLEKLPLLDADGRLAGLITTKDIMRSLQHPHATKDEKGRLRVGAAVGVQPGFLERAELLLEAGADVLVVDIAHGHSDNCDPRGAGFAPRVRRGRDHRGQRGDAPRARAT